MAALTGPLDNQEKQGHVCTYALGAGKRVFKGSLVVLEGGTGLLEAGTDTAARTFVGVAYETGDNLAGANGAVSARVQKQGTFVYSASGASQSWVGQAVYIVDDQTVGLASVAVNDIECGRVVECLSAARVRIRIDNSVR